MFDPTGYIVTGVVSLAVGYALRRLEPKSKIVYWLPHTFFFDLKNEKVVLLTNALTVQNIGSRPAERIEIIHKARPDFFQFAPAVDFEEATSPTGEHILRIQSLAPKEVVTLQLLSYKSSAPVLMNIRSKEKPAESIAIQPQRIVARWLQLVIVLLLIVGLGFSTYWLIRAVVHISQQIGVA